MRFQVVLRFTLVSAAFCAAAGGISLGVPPDSTPAEAVAARDCDASEPTHPILDWRDVESTHYQTYIANLQSSGCPAQTIRDIVTADVVQLYAKRRAKAVTACCRDFDYWRADPSAMEARAKLASDKRAIDDEMNGVIKELLGADVALPDTARAWQQAELEYKLSFLPARERKQTVAILADYAKVDRQTRELAAGMFLTEDTNELDQIVVSDQEKQTKLEQLLSPEDFERVEMTTSWTSENLRRAMVHFHPNKVEFKIIFDAWRPHDENLARIHALRQPDPGNLQNAVYAKIKARLSEDRYEEYCRTWWK